MAARYYADEDGDDNNNKDNNPLAYGEYHSHPDEGQTDRGLFTDVYRRLRGRHSGAVTDDYQGHGPPPYQQPPPAAPSASAMSFLFDKMHSAVHGIGAELKEKISGQGETHGHTHMSGQCSDGTHSQRLHRFQSFAPEREGNDVKWYVDGCGYMYAVSMALESARESIWILDCAS
ncbi:hypothetical protein LTR50_007795 [Elasticomyces elasticus]|nr:hypothetical protein LTR50_007795 [Elasticomyces elasticus]